MWCKTLVYGVCRSYIRLTAGTCMLYVALWLVYVALCQVYVGLMSGLWQVYVVCLHQWLRLRSPCSFPGCPLEWRRRELHFASLPVRKPCWRSVVCRRQHTFLLFFFISLFFLALSGFFSSPSLIFFLRRISSFYFLFSLVSPWQPWASRNDVGGFPNLRVCRSGGGGVVGVESAQP